MIILRSPKGWTGPKQVDGHKVEGFWRAHQVPVLDVKSNPEHLQIVEQWMRSYRPEELFDQSGGLVAELRDRQPVGDRRMSANPHANGGKLRKPLHLPDFRDYAISVDRPGTKEISPTETLGKFLRDVMRSNMTNFGYSARTRTRPTGCRMSIRRARRPGWRRSNQKMPTVRTSLRTAA